MSEVQKLGDEEQAGFRKQSNAAERMETVSVTERQNERNALGITAGKRAWSRRELLGCGLLGTGAVLAGSVLPGAAGGGTVSAAVYGGGPEGEKAACCEDGSDLPVTATGTTESRRLGDVLAELGSAASFGEAVYPADATAILQAAIDHFDYIDIPPGTYAVSELTIPSRKTIRNRGHIQGTVRVIGPDANERGLYIRERVNGSGSLTAGATVLNGSFPGYSVGDFIMIGLQGAGLASTNQQGYDFATVAAVTPFSLTLDTPLRWGYPDWYVAKTVGTNWTGALQRGAYTIAGSFGHLFAPGDLLRIENRNGTDCWYGIPGHTELVPGGSKAYFEQARIKSVGTSELVLEQELAYSHTDPVLIKMDAVADVTISGGRIDTITARGCDNFRLYDLHCSALSVSYSVGFSVDQIRADGQSPIVCGFSHVRDAVISNVVTRGGTGVTDNGSFKMMSPIGVTVSNIRSLDTVCTSAQGVYPFFLDFYFTPYAGWGQEVTVGNLALSKPKQGAQHSLWATGMRELTVTNVTAAGTIRFSKCSGLQATGLSAGGALNMEDLIDGGIVSGFQAAFVNVLGCSDLSVCDGVVRGANGQNSSRAIWVRGGIARPTSERVTLQNIKNRSTTAGDTTIYVQTAADTTIAGCSDRPGLNKSVQIGSNAGEVHYGLNSLRNAIDVSAAINGRTVAAADLALQGHRWDRARLRLGDYALWVDAAGTLRIMHGNPTGDSDGTAVGAQV